MSGATPQSQHESMHSHPEQPIADCRQCRLERRNCQRKHRYVTAEAAATGAQERNIKTQWRLMLTPYRCPWCQMHHLTRATPGTRQWKRVGRRRQAYEQEQQ